MQKAKFIIKLPGLIAAVLLVLLWSITLWAYTRLPESIPVHFNFKGEVDRYGSKSNLFLLAIIATVIYSGLTLLPAKLKQFNFPNKTTIENSNAQIAFAENVFMFLKIIILFIFLAIIIATYMVSSKKAEGLGMWFYLLLAILFLPTIFIIGKAIKTK